MHLLYSVQHDHVVFAHKSDDESSEQLWHAIRTAKTWGEFRALVSDETWSDLELSLEEAETDFGDEDEFNPEMLPGYGDGDYPPPLQQSTLDWFPEDLVERHGTVLETRLSGEQVEFSLLVLDELLKDLEERGYTTERTELDLY